MPAHPFLTKETEKYFPPRFSHVSETEPISVTYFFTSPKEQINLQRMRFMFVLQSDISRSSVRSIKKIRAAIS